jgi:hypothetical protein
VKITKGPAAFTPVTFVVETAGEAAILAGLISPTNNPAMQDAAKNHEGVKASREDCQSVYELYCALTVK